MSDSEHQEITQEQPATKRNWWSKWGGNLTLTLVVLFLGYRLLLWAAPSLRMIFEANSLPVHPELQSSPFSPSTQERMERASSADPSTVDGVSATVSAWGSTVRDLYEANQGTLDERIARETHEIEGHWFFTSLSSDGRNWDDVTSNGTPNVCFEFERGRVRFINLGLDTLVVSPLVPDPPSRLVFEGVAGVGRYDVNSEKNPDELTLHFQATQAPQDGPVAEISRVLDYFPGGRLAIYNIEGEVLTICIFMNALEDAGRPKDFNGTEGVLYFRLEKGFKPLPNLQ